VDAIASGRKDRAGGVRASQESVVKGAAVIDILNGLVAAVENHLDEELDVAAFAAGAGTTEYHLRRMFSSLAGMPVSDYIRRRRMTVAAADVIGGEDLLTIAVRYGYGSTEAFGRAFHTVHGVRPGDVRRAGGPLRSQAQLRFRLTVEGSTTMDARIVDKPAFRLVGYAARVPLIYEGINPHIAEHIRSLPDSAFVRLKELGNMEPSGVLQVSADAEGHTEGSELTHMQGVAVGADTDVPDDLDVIEAEAGSWAVFRTSGEHPKVLQDTWAATATEWFPSNPWRLRPGPSIVAVLDSAEDFSTATCELWLPVERA